MKWINSTGGPLILLPKKLIKLWNGTYGDYDRAYEVEEMIDLIEVGTGKAVILNDEPMQTSQLKFDNNSCLLIRWIYAASEEDIT